MPLGSRRFQLCSALPFQILESHLQALPWLLFAFPCRTIPHPFGSLRLRWPRFQFCSFRLLSQLLLISAMPIWTNRFSAAPLRFVSCLGRTNPLPFDANQSRADHLRCFSSPPDANPLTSNPWQFSAACADQCRARSVRFPSAQFGAPPFPRYSSPVLSRRIRAFSSRHKSCRRGSFLFLSHPLRFFYTPVGSSAIRDFSVRRHSTRGLSVSLRGDSGLRTSLAMPFTSVPFRCLADRFESLLRSAVSTLFPSGLIHAVATLRTFGNQALFAAFFSASFLAFFAFIAAAAFRPSSV